MQISLNQIYTVPWPVHTVTVCSTVERYCAQLPGHCWHGDVVGVEAVIVSGMVQCCCPSLMVMVLIVLVTSVDRATSIGAIVPLLVQYCTDLVNQICTVLLACQQ